MKRKEYLAQLRNASLGDLQKQIAEIERQIQSHKVALVFGKTKEVARIGMLRRQLAQALTVANAQLRNSIAPSTPEENHHA